jgi:hypothetical protein
MNIGDKIILREPLVVEHIDGSAQDEFGRAVSCNEGLVRLWESDLVPVEGEPVELWGVWRGSSLREICMSRPDAVVRARLGVGYSVRPLIAYTVKESKRD